MPSASLRGYGTSDWNGTRVVFLKPEVALPERTVPFIFEFVAFAGAETCPWRIRKSSQNCSGRSSLVSC
jgi:hypothetical protein